MSSSISGMVRSELFMRLCVLNVVVLLISNIIAVKMISTMGLVFPAGVIVFPVTYILSDIFSEVYGYRASRITAWYAFSANLLMVLCFKLAILLPGAQFWSPEMQNSFELVLGGTWRILLASLAAYMFGDWINDIIFQKLKSRHGEKKFSLRAIVSTMIGEGIDSFLFLIIAFWGTPLFDLWAVPSQWFLKVLYQIILIPVIIIIVRRVKTAENYYDNYYKKI